SDRTDARCGEPERGSDRVCGCRRSRGPGRYRRSRGVPGAGPMKRLILIAVALIVALGFLAPHVDIDFMRPRIERAIERGLSRRVEVGRVYINLFTGPGFTVEDVKVHEDPRAGAELFIYVRSLEARVRLLSLFSRRLEFSSLRLAD